MVWDGVLHLLPTGGEEMSGFRRTMFAICSRAKSRADYAVGRTLPPARKRPSVFAAGWRAGGAPGLRPEKMCFTVSTKTDAPHGWFSRSLRRVAVFGPYRSAPGGRAEPASSPGRSSIPLDPVLKAGLAPGCRSLPETRKPDSTAVNPAPSAPAATRSQALRALRATGREECCTVLR